MESHATAHYNGPYQMTVARQSCHLWLPGCPLFDTCVSLHNFLILRKTYAVYFLNVGSERPDDVPGVQRQANGLIKEASCSIRASLPSFTFFSFCAKLMQCI